MERKDVLELVLFIVLLGLIMFLSYRVIMLETNTHKFTPEETEYYDEERNASILGSTRDTKFTVYYMNVPFFLVKQTTLHEFGHYYLNIKIDYNAEYEYYNITENSDEFITNYARTNHMEDFSESFEHITDICYYESQLEDLTPERQQWFRDNVLDDFKECDGKKSFNLWERLKLILR